MDLFASHFRKFLLLKSADVFDAQKLNYFAIGDFCRTQISDFGITFRDFLFCFNLQNLQKKFVLNQNKIKIKQYKNTIVSNIIFFLMCKKFLSHEYRILSSAKLRISDFPMKRDMLFINLLNNSRPNNDPLGIPRKTSDQLL